MNILVGADPEVFVKQNGTFRSAYGLIKGDKRNPFKVDNGAVQVDGMALEFNIDPANSEEAFVGNIQSVMQQLSSMVPEYQVEAVPVATFGSDYINAQPLKARELGCDPDYNAWSGQENVSPDEELPFRTGAGHVHIGWTDGENIDDEGHRDTAMRVARQMDFYLGLPSLLFDGDTMRRSMYGCAGAFRTKTYGVEYRTLSNVWLQDELSISWVYRAISKGLADLAAGIDLAEIHGDIQDIINTSDTERARELIKTIGLEVPYVGQ
jgi:hypothetical protein